MRFIEDERKGRPTDSAQGRPRTQRKRPSMYDVATLAGVSQTTVSFVVNDSPNANIPQETRDRIWAAVEALGWRRNALARGLRLRRSHSVGFISDDIATSSHGGKIIQGAQDAAWADGKMLLLTNTSGNPAIEHAALEMLLERQVEGIIYAAMYHRPVTPPAELGGVPTVLLDCFVADRSLSSVVPDEVQGGRAATEALLNKGHRRIAFINTVDRIPAAGGRLVGYQQALASRGVAFDPDLVHEGSSGAAEGYRGAMELLQSPERPTGLFCFNDAMAMGAYEAVKQLGLAIPQDVAIVGFDNHELIAGQLSPPLTTMELPHYAMGQWAVQYLFQHQETVPMPPTQHTIPCRLIERSSV